MFLSKINKINNIALAKCFFNLDAYSAMVLQARGKKRTSGIFPGNHVKIMCKTDKKAVTPTTTPNDTPATSGRTTPQLTEEAVKIPSNLLSLLLSSHLNTCSIAFVCSFIGFVF